jgi:hypothetical protein
MTMGDPNAAIELSLARADRLILAGHGSTLQILQDADLALSKRLHRIAQRHGGPDGSYTEAHALLYREQIRLVTAYMQNRLAGKTAEQAREAIKFGVKQTVETATMLERRFTGITRPLALHSQIMQDEIVRGTGASMIRRNESSWQRYGEVMTRSFERVLRVAQVTGMTQSETISRIVKAGAHGGINAAGLHVNEPGYFPAPTGYVDRRYWAERIVRTETASALNSASLNTMQGFKNTDFPDMKKKILAHFDNRTAPDSMAVHGQIRPLDGYFMDGAGRQYLNPPGRPNDRETVIPWRDHWEELEATREPDPKDVVEAQQAAQPGQPMPAPVRRAQVAAVKVARAQEQAKQAETAAFVRMVTAQPEPKAQPATALESVAPVTVAEKIAALKVEKAAAVESAKVKLKAKRKPKAKPELNTGAPLPKVLPVDKQGTPILPLPAMPKRPLPKDAPEVERLEKGRTLRAQSVEGGELSWRRDASASLAHKNELHQERMWRGSRRLMDSDEAEAVRAYSWEHDFLIRRYQSGASRARLIELETEHRKAKGTYRADDASSVVAKVERVIRAAHNLERAFVHAEDSPVPVVFRGIGGLSSDKLSLLLGSKHFSMLGMVSSASLDPTVAEWFAEQNTKNKGGHGVILRLKRKSKAFGISAVAVADTEQEVLIHGNARFRILSRHRIRDYLGFETWEIDAEEI